MDVGPLIQNRADGKQFLRKNNISVVLFDRIIESLVEQRQGVALASHESVALVDLEVYVNLVEGAQPLYEMGVVRHFYLVSLAHWSIKAEVDGVVERVLAEVLEH